MTLSRELAVSAQFSSMSATTDSREEAPSGGICSQSLPSSYFTDKGSCPCYSSDVPLSHTPAPATILRLWVCKESMDKAVSQHWRPNMKEGIPKVKPLHSQSLS